MNKYEQPTESRYAFLPDNGIDIRRIIEQLYQYRWFMLGTTVITFFIALCYTFTITPHYQTTAALQIKTQNMGGGSLFKSLRMSSANSSVDTLVALLKTRYILEPVIIEKKLNVSISPAYFSFFGAWMARHYNGKGLAKPFMGLNAYAWGGEEFEIKELKVPVNVDRSFQLIAGPGNTYQFYSDTGKLLFSGKVGELATDKSGTIQLQLSTFKARPGTKFTVTYQSPVNLINPLAGRIQVSPIFGTDPTQSTGIIQLQLMGSNPNEIVTTLNSIIQYIVVKNIQQKTDEMQNTLNFLKQRLPELKLNLEKVENTLNQYHMRTDTLSMSMVSQSLIRQLFTVQAELAKLATQKEELLQVYTPQHPLIIIANGKEQGLQQKLASIKAEIRKFPALNQQEVTLLREAKIRTSTYINLLNNQQQLEIANASVTTDVLPLSDAIPPARMPSHKISILFSGILMGLFLSSFVVLIKALLFKTIESSEELEEALNIPVRCILPYSRQQKKIEKVYERKVKGSVPASSLPLVLVKQAPEDVLAESLRGLRVSLQLLSPMVVKPIIAMMGSTSNIGKSFISLNLAQIFAESGKRTLLIDADIRRGRLHKSLLQPKSNGLSEYMESSCQYEDIFRSLNNKLFFISCGSYTRQPTELFQNSRFPDLLEKAANDFDQIIVDNPPLLPVTDSLLITRHCNIKLFVVSAKEDKLVDVRQSIKKAQAHNIDINGIVFNYRRSDATYGGAYYYRYAYTTTTT
ncbi:MAG TPA: polysaccharide biosynthesis tyrosine autokinase [Gammaproteobacteria bacterium]|nr:MAG: hypothetical protein A3E83_06825 [Gammaproteobacteria bacterium RIFCSPHIGHO2_12_FULL_41_20]HLB43526.1 polysaccharide biosynthesis tyrosine autokinase [Gammaproteobacteria bacterium]